MADLRCSDISSYIELPLHAVHNDVQVQLAHALNDSLVGFIIPGEVEGGVLLGQLVQSSSHLVIVCFALGLNGNLQGQSSTQTSGHVHKTGNSLGLNGNLYRRSFDSRFVLSTQAQAGKVEPFAVLHSAKAKLQPNIKPSTQDRKQSQGALTG